MANQEQNIQRFRIVIEVDSEVDHDRIDAVAKHIAAIVQQDRRIKIVYLATEVVEEARNILEDHT